MREEMTSGEAGCTLTRFTERWEGSLDELEGRDRRRRWAMGGGFNEVRV